MHTDIARGAFEIPGTGNGDVSEPADTQERGVELGKSLILGVLSLSRHDSSTQKSYMRQSQTLGLCPYTQGGLRSNTLAGTHCEDPCRRVGWPFSMVCVRIFVVVRIPLYGFWCRGEVGYIFCKFSRIRHAAS
jgi:hypothetical protein